MSLYRSLLLVFASLLLAGCMPDIWNAGDLADWVRQEAVKQGCTRDSITLEDWYRSTAKGNIWHGSCRNAAGSEQGFAINVDPVWTPSGEGQH